MLLARLPTHRASLRNISQFRPHNFLFTSTDSIFHPPYPCLLPFRFLSPPSPPPPPPPFSPPPPSPPFPALRFPPPNSPPPNFPPAHINHSILRTTPPITPPPLSVS